MSRLSCIRTKLVSIEQRTARPRPKQVDSYYQSKEHLDWRRIIIDRAVSPYGGYVCQVCGETTETPHADHIIEIVDGGDRTDPMNGQCLCPKCHNQKTAVERMKRRAKRR